jgi:hypothetical protein
VHAPEIFFPIESCAFHVAYHVIVFAWLYRHVKKEVRRRDDHLLRWPTRLPRRFPWPFCLWSKRNSKSSARRV